MVTSTTMDGSKRKTIGLSLPFSLPSSSSLFLTQQNSFPPSLSLSLSLSLSHHRTTTAPQVCQPNGEVVITNDGATILNKMTVTQPAAKMLVELARSQDAAAGDGTTSVTVICGALLTACLKLLERGMHPTVVSDGFARAAEVALEAVEGLAIPVDLADREELAKAASTSLQSKVVSQHAALLAPMAVDCVLKGKERLCWFF